MTIGDPAPQRQARQDTSTRSSMDDDGLRRTGEWSQRLGHSQRLEYAHAVGADLNAGAFFPASSMDVRMKSLLSSGGG